MGGLRESKREVPKSITFFMVVTNRDAHIASYAIKSFQKVAILSEQYEWKLVVFANCLSEAKRDDTFPVWRTYPYVEIIDYTKDDAEIKNSEGPYLNCGEVWKYAFNNCDSDYLCLVDADFEIFHPQFVVELLRILEDFPAVGIMAADYSPNSLVHYVYDGTVYYAKERCHTWFCFYKRNVLKIDESLETCHKTINGLLISYDHTAYFQEQCFLKHDVIFQGLSAMTQEYVDDYIHYAAFSKNRTLDTQKKIARFRRFAILSRIGIYSVINPHGTMGKILRYPNKLVKKIFHRLFMRMYGSVQKERTLPNPVNPLDS